MESGTVVFLLSSITLTLSCLQASSLTLFYILYEEEARALKDSEQDASGMKLIFIKMSIF